jgi:chloramphenicol 3-O phosphotransferase
MKNKIIFINGTSGSGKSSLAIALQNQLEEPFWNVSSDQLIKARFLPLRDFEGGRFNWHQMRPHFFKTFHNCLPSIVNSGNNIIVDHIIEEVEWLKDLQVLLKDTDIFFVGVHCSLEELRKREMGRLNEKIGLVRFIGEFEEHLATHNFCRYDFEVDTTQTSSVESAQKVIQAWEKRSGTSRFFESA